MSDHVISNEELLDRLRAAGRDGVRMSDVSYMRFVRYRIKDLRDAGYRIGEATFADDDGNPDTLFVLLREPDQPQLRTQNFSETEQGPKPPSRGPARDVSVQPPLPQESPH